MGQFEEATYDSLQVPIEAGDRFFLYTDGILETSNPAQEEFGTDRFMQFMETNNKLTAGPFADALLLEPRRIHFSATISRHRRTTNDTATNGERNRYQ